MDADSETVNKKEMYNHKAGATFKHVLHAHKMHIPFLTRM